DGVGEESARDHYFGRPPNRQQKRQPVDQNTKQLIGVSEGETEEAPRRENRVAPVPPEADARLMQRHVVHRRESRDKDRKGQQDSDDVGSPPFGARSWMAHGGWREPNSGVSRVARGGWS